MIHGDRQIVEVFHLSVLRLLMVGPDQSRFALKGGCNLRFFFGSVRYSEGMDLDVAQGVETHFLKDKMNRLLAGSTLGNALSASGIRLGAVSAPKQTETTQRWKAELRAEGRSLALHTKIEFSRRKSIDEAELGALDSAISRAYQMLPLLVTHYPVAAAMCQKVQALVGRQVVQARDVFDLAVLFARAGGRVEALSGVREILPKAVERAMDVSFDEYQGQVVAYLDPVHVLAHSSRQAWDALQTSVVETLERAAR